MHVTYRVKVDATSGDTTWVYLYAHEGWFIFPTWFDFFILQSKYVPIADINKTKREMLRDADTLYARYKEIQKIETSVVRKTT